MSSKNTILPSTKTHKVLTPGQIAWRAARQKEVELWERGVNNSKRAIYLLRLEESDIQGLDDPTCRPKESLDLAEIRKKIDEQSFMLIFHQSFVDRLNAVPHRAELRVNAATIDS
jgi:hypothetical protein